jgi:purine-binding chemotaxis protein CheW
MEQENTEALQNTGVNQTDTAQLTSEQINASKEQLSVIDYKMVTFSLADKDYAIDIMKVKEIAKAGHFTYVPNTMPFVLGVYNLRGDIIPIIDLRLFFNIEVPERNPNVLENVLIVTIEERTFGIVVDAIDKVVGIQKSTIQPPHPLFGDINIAYIYGVVESNNRLYILLDIDRIFGDHAEEDDKETPKMDVRAVSHAVNAQPEVTSAPSNTQTNETSQQSAEPVAENEKVSRKDDINFKFVCESLKSFRKFNVSSVNDKWAEKRFDEWEQEKGAGKTQLQNETETDAFMKPFYSRCNGTWWTKEYADAVYKALPENSAKQISVWNPGCGKGYEAYSLACLLKKRYPNARIRIYGHDIDLLSVSNAPLLNIPANVASDWYSSYTTKTVNGETTFDKSIKDMILFEYHDCVNTNALPVVDIIFARDIVSFLPLESQNKLIADFGEKIKGNGIVVLGDNESLAGRDKWTENNTGSVVTFSKQ